MLFPWKRFWYRRGGTYRLDLDGYVVDPDGKHGPILQPGVVSFEAIADRPCLILLGEPGIGKSTTLVQHRDAVEAQVRAAGDDILWLDLKPYGSESRLIDHLFGGQEFREWQAGTHTLHLFLDSLDECRLLIPQVAALLLDRLQRVRHDIPRLHLRIACRTADLPDTLQKGLPDLWGEEAVGVYQLVPLRRVDVRAAVEGSGLDADAFFEEVQRVGAEPLAIKPVTLDFLIKTYAQSETFPARQADLYQKGCRILCTETSDIRRDARHAGQLSPDQRLAVAARIAAVLVFCRKTAIYLGPSPADSSSDDVPLAQLGGGSEPIGQDTLEVTESGVKEVLGTGLFSGRGPQRLGFAHQTYAEFLAGRYVVVRHLELRQIRSLIQHHGDPDRAIPQLAQTAGWLAGMRPELFRTIMQSEPAVLLRGDVASADVQDTAALVRSLLHLYECGQTHQSDFELRKYYRKLSHPGLAAQLRAYIEDRRKAPLAREVAIHIAHHARVRELHPLLADIALDPQEHLEVRIDAAIAVAVTADRDIRLRLMPLVTEPHAEDPDEELKGWALRGLWADRLISAQELFKHLEVPRNEQFHGPYDAFLGMHLVEHLEPDELPTALRWLANHRGHSYTFYKLNDEILLLASEHMDAPGVSGAMAELVLARLRKDDQLLLASTDEQRAQLFTADAAKRGAVMKALVPLLAEANVDPYRLAYGQATLARREDFAWFLDQAVTAPGGEAQVWATLTRALLNVDDWAQVDAIVTAAASQEGIREEFASLLEPIPLDSPRAAELRERWREIERLQEEMRSTPGRKPPEPSPAQVKECLHRVEAGDLDAWWHLMIELGLDSEEPWAGDHPDTQIPSMLGWNQAEPGVRARIVAGAAKYLTKRTPEPDTWIGKDIYDRPDAAGYRALYLLMQEAPDRLAALPDAVWATWAPVVLAYPAPIGWVGQQEPHLDLIRLAYTHAPEQVMQTLERLIDCENARGDHLFVLQKLERCWDTRLCDLLLKKAQDPALKPQCLASLLEQLLQRKCRGTEEYAQSLVRVPLSPDETGRAKAEAVATVLLLKASDAGWSVVWPAIRSDLEFGKRVMTAVARSPGQWSNAEVATRLKEQQAADLYVWLETQFPHKDDPRVEGVHRPGTREEIGHFRDAVLGQLARRGTSAACEAIQGICDRFPGLPHARWILEEAREATLRETWLPPAPEELLALARSREARLVQSGGQLLDVLVESLGHLQDELQAETPAARDIWDKQLLGGFCPSEENHLSDYVKRHLERDLKRSGVVVSREVEIRRGSGGAPGEHTDIHVTAVTKASEPAVHDQVTVIIETKGCWHPELKTAMQTQLVDRYLKDNRCHHGLYLVGWYKCPQWDSNDRRRGKCLDWDIKEAQEFFDQQAARLSQGPLHIRAFVLNTALR